MWSLLLLTILPLTHSQNFYGLATEHSFCAKSTCDCTGGLCFSDCNVNAYWTQDASITLAECQGHCDNEPACVGVTWGSDASSSTAGLCMIHGDTTMVSPGDTWGANPKSEPYTIYSADGYVFTGMGSTGVYCYVVVPDPTVSPSLSPVTSQPTASPSRSPSKKPTASPSKSPSTTPPTVSPTKSPSVSPTRSPTKNPTTSPITSAPSTSPTKSPSLSPSTSPTLSPDTSAPTNAPSKSPTMKPSVSPSVPPTESPVTSAPTNAPSKSPTMKPSVSPSVPPTESPITSAPTNAPSVSPTVSPTDFPSVSPTLSPDTSAPTNAPTKSPTDAPTPAPTGFPSVSPVTSSPSMSPSGCPSVSPETSSPSSAPSRTECSDLWTTTAELPVTATYDGTDVELLANADMTDLIDTWEVSEDHTMWIVVSSTCETNIKFAWSGFNDHKFVFDVAASASEEQIRSYDTFTEEAVNATSFIIVHQNSSSSCDGATVTIHSAEFLFGDCASAVPVVATTEEAVGSPTMYPTYENGYGELFIYVTFENITQEEFAEKNETVLDMLADSLGAERQDVSWELVTVTGARRMLSTNVNGDAAVTTYNWLEHNTMLETAENVDWQETYSADVAALFGKNASTYDVYITAVDSESTAGSVEVDPTESSETDTITAGVVVAFIIVAAVIIFCCVRCCCKKHKDGEEVDSEKEDIALCEKGQISYQLSDDGEYGGDDLKTEKREPMKYNHIHE